MVPDPESDTNSKCFVVINSFKINKPQDPKAGRHLDPDKPECITSCRGGETDPDFSRPFFGNFVPNPRLL